ncbi:hypothetical protein FKG94_18125 [Exilibacterium tricleocarpae]|uniref:DUF2007 domain-containing protein n=1 Tax=Exilibacterium tricleocarpae TaxID=2591008 RepID=A0A545T621_9GAMM|nr:DUF6164 family protein [Exilibacterium tricleocarpae]TQV72612.1 hypothetical protein FKG94_18125 [Exilibacterium tricleocarpae]
MSTLLIKLNGVPDDEADDIRNLLAANNIDYYETSAGNWGVSLAAIWLQHADQLDTAKALLDNYQQERLLRVRAEYREQLDRDGPETLWDRWKKEPLRALVYLGLVALIAYISLAPFLGV